MARILFRLFVWSGWIGLIALAALFAAAPKSARESFAWAAEKALWPSTPKQPRPLSNFNPPLRYFPADAFSGPDGTIDEFSQKWFSGQLAGLEEPAIFEATPETYRFLYLRTFHTPVSVRIEQTASGVWQLTAKRADGAGGYNPGLLEDVYYRALSSAEGVKLQKYLESAKIWSHPDRNLGAGMDGSEWVFEAVKNGQYVSLARFNGGEEPGFRELCLWLLKIGRVDGGPHY